ncbi:MAG: sulfotransferase domain-containing protein [Candidatus Wenzhouxiangella sp. M2_3B_020]
MQSLLTLSMHKAGSTIADQIILEFCVEKGYDVDRISRQVRTSSVPESQVFVNYQSAMRTEGIYYGVARGPYVADMSIIPFLKVIVHVRDPRDCLTSSYYSSRYSHAPPKNPDKVKVFREKRDQASRMTIDEFVLARVRGYVERMQILKNIVQTHDNALLLNYETMVEETQVWLGKIAGFLDVDITDELKRRINDKADFNVDKEDLSQHKRQVRPGDHERKLEPSTIKALDNALGDLLDYFGYVRS